MIKLSNLLGEESFTAVNKSTGKVSVFKSKDSRDAAVKAGTHDKKEDDGEKEPKGGKPNMFSKDAGYDAGDDGLGWGDETDRDTSLPKDASELNSNHMGEFGDAMDAESGLSGTTDIDDNSGAIVYYVGNGEGDEPTYSIFIGSNDDYGKPEEFRVSLEPNYGNDPAGLSGKVDKTFKTAEEAKKFAAQVAKKYSKEMQMDDSEEYDTTSSKSEKSKPFSMDTDEKDFENELESDGFSSYVGGAVDGVSTFGDENGNTVSVSAGEEFGVDKPYFVSGFNDEDPANVIGAKGFDTKEEAIAYAKQLGQELQKQYPDKMYEPNSDEPEVKGALLPSQEKKDSFHWTRGKLQPKAADKKLVSLVNKLSRKAKLDPDKISREEYEKRMLSVVHDALEDANFHGANRQIFADLLGKPELAKRPDYSKAPEMGTPEREEWDMNNSIYNKNFDAITIPMDDARDAISDINSQTGWDGEKTLAALLTKMRKDGAGRLADKIQTSFEKAMANNEAKLKLGDLI